ncbi:unnamed protein product [Pylaiella littoralis]
MTFSVLGPFLPAYISGRFGSTSTQVGMIMAAYPAVNLATSPLVGWIMNRWGRLRSLFAGLVILTVATALYGMASSVSWLYIASGLHGASLSFIHVSSLGLLSAFPDRITESMAGIEIWSGVAQILGPPLGCLVVPYGGVSSVFLLVAMFPVGLVFFAPSIMRTVRSIKGVGDSGGDMGLAGASGSFSMWKVARNRGVLAGAFVTAYNYGIIGFLEVTLAPHLAITLSTSPRTIGFVLVLPNVLYTLTAAKAEDIVDRHGVRRTLLLGLCIMSMSLVLYGPSPVLAPALVTRGAARGAIGVGLLAFQVGSALASVPAFTAMQGGVAGMGMGADDMVASAHAMAIGVGEVIGPMLGGYVVELLPKSPAFACEPNTPIVELHDPIFQLGGELRPHGHKKNKGGGGDFTSLSEKDSTAYSDAPDVEGAVDAREDARDKESTVVREGEEDEVARIAGAGGGRRARQLLFFGERVAKVQYEWEEDAGSKGNTRLMMTARTRGEEVEARGLSPGEAKADGEAEVVAGEHQQGGRKIGRLRGEKVGEEEGGEGVAGKNEEARRTLRVAAVPEGAAFEAPGTTAAAAAAATSSEGRAKRGEQQQQQQQKHRLLEQRSREGGHRGRAKRDARRGPQVLPAAAAAAAAAAGDSAVGVSAASGSDGVAEGGQEGGRSGGGDSGGSSGSCESAFPLATTVLAWASGFAVLAMYRMLPSQAAASKGARVGLP